MPLNRCIPVAFLATCMVLSGCGSDTAGIEPAKATTISPPNAAETTEPGAQWCADFLSFDERPTSASITVMLEAAPARLESELEMLRPLFLAVANFDESDPASETQLLELRNNPEISAASDAVNSYIDSNC